MLTHEKVRIPLQRDDHFPVGQQSAALGPESDTDYTTERDASTKLRQDHATYAAMLESTDASVGRIVEKLTEQKVEVAN